MRKILNVSNHKLTEEQILDLKNMYNDDIKIVELPDNLKKSWSNLTPKNYIEVCRQIDALIEDESIKTIHLAGFAPAIIYLISINDYAIEEGDLEFIYSYSERQSTEEEINGKIVKTSVFKHKGWYYY